MMKKLLFAITLFSSVYADDFTMPKDPVVVMETTQGNIEVKLFPEVAPKAVENFIRLANKGYYNHVAFHRIIPNFMIQGGDPKGTGTGGESIWGKPFEDEFNPQVKYDRPYLLGMANAGPKTNGSQFFITTIPTPWLNNKHTIFGEVISGTDVVKKLEAQGSPSGAPKEMQSMIRVYLK